MDAQRDRKRELPYLIEARYRCRNGRYTEWFHYLAYKDESERDNHFYVKVNGGDTTFEFRKKDEDHVKK